MALIAINELNFCYDGAQKPLFEGVSLDMDTRWKLGLVGRNGRGKTTFLKLLMGQLPHTGTITSPTAFEYFPFQPAHPGWPALRVVRQSVASFEEWEAEMEALLGHATPEAIERYGEVEAQYALAGGYTMEEEIRAEAGRLDIHPEALERPFNSLSGGEQVKLLLVALFLKRHRFLLVDEPTDHLDAQGRKTVARWLAGKSGFILVSHDRQFLDDSVDHILSINRSDIQLQRGNYSSWRVNRRRQDESELAQNKKLEKDIVRLKQAAERTEKWSANIEKSKVSVLDPNRRGPAMLDRGYIGHQAARMMQRSKSIERRRGRQIEEKQTLLKNIEEAEAVRLQVMKAPKKRLVTGEGLALAFGERTLFSQLELTIEAGERIALAGPNGCGKSSLLRLVLGQNLPTAGSLQCLSGLVISTLPQETDFLKGHLADFARAKGLDLSLFLAILRKLDFEREAFERGMESFSAGQKKKVCLAASLATPAHLFVWDEPLNYIDVLSREQVENAVLESDATLLFVEHDASFAKAVATRTIAL